MALTIKPKKVGADLSPSKEIEVTITHRATGRKYKVLKFNKASGEMVIQSGDDVKFNSHWEQRFFETYIVDYKLREIK